MRSGVLFVGVVGLLIFAFQNCAPAVSKDAESAKNSRCSLKSSSKVLVSSSHSEVHKINDDGIVRTHIPNIDEFFGIKKYDWRGNGQEKHLVIADNSLVVLSEDFAIEDRVFLEKGTCKQPFERTADGLKVAGYEIYGRTARYIGCGSKKLGTSSCNSNVRFTEEQASRGRSGSSSRSNTDGFTDVGNIGGSNGLGSGTRSPGTGSGENLGEKVNCSNLKNGQTAWEYFDSKTVSDPECHGPHVRYITTTFEREIRCTDGTRVPTGNKREKENKISSGRCYAQCKTYEGKSVVALEGRSSEVFMQNMTKNGCTYQIYHRISCGSDGVWKKQSEYQRGNNCYNMGG